MPFIPITFIDFYNVQKMLYILYNTEADVLTGGEKSRFITQLEFEEIHKIKHQIIAPKVPIIESQLNTIVKKTEDLLNRN